MAARFKSHVHRCALRRITRIPQRHDFGMLHTGPGVKSAPNNLVIVHDHSTHRWIWTGSPGPLLGKLNAPAA